jgi:hypothetical protein
MGLRDLILIGQVREHWDLDRISKILPFGNRRANDSTEHGRFVCCPKGRII